MVERMTGYGLLFKVEDKTSVRIAEVIVHVKDRHQGKFKNALQPAV